MPRRGFTLTEVLMAVTLVGILAVMAVPQYTKTVERGYWRHARDTLMTIYFGERTYQTFNNAYLNNPITPADWQQIYMDNPNGLPSIPVSFAVAASAGLPPTFTATATRLGTGPCGGRTLTINQDRQFVPTLNPWPESGIC